MEEKKNRDIFERIWTFFASVRLAIFLLIILALSSIIGTIVEQNAEPAQNIKLLAKFFGDSAAPGVYNVFAKLGFMDMYDSWWFLSFLTLFSINLIVCSLERLPKTWRLVKTPLRPVAESKLNALPVKKNKVFSTSFNVAKDEILNALGTSGYHVNEATEEDSVQLYSQKGRYARLAVYVVHLSIILIFIGAIVGARYGFRGYLNLPEGSSSSRAYLSPEEPVPLGFTVKCNWYDTQYYKESDAPKEFQSELVIIEDGREVLTKVIEVNDPLKYKGITFYQASFGMLPEPAAGKFVLDIRPGGGQENTVWLGLGDTFRIPGTEVKGRIVDFSPALTRDRATGMLTTYSQNMVNPAIAIEFSEPGRDTYTGWILKRYPETGMLPGGHEVMFRDYWGVEFTGLQVAKDPGVWLIYLASVIMAVALYVCFFISHKKIWVTIANDKNSVRITAGGSTNRNRIALEKEIERILSNASEAIEERSRK